MTEHVNVLVVGAGLSGIGAGYYLQTHCPTKSYAILEARDAIGGTWDLFRYPGVRSDSDMFTLGYSFRPWKEAKAIADGPSILKYVRETAQEYGIDRHIRFGHRVRSAAWSSQQAQWTVEAERTSDGERVQFTCDFLYLCGGYYDYANGYTPEWPGVERYRGCIVHPQKWPENLDYTGKRVVIIGSGATAVTLAPAMADRAAHVTMLQRSPTYIVSRPSQDALAAWALRHLPRRIAYFGARWKAILLSIYFYWLARWKPDLTKREIVKLTRQELGPDYDVETHFTPSYNPWDQRLCLVPDSDLFKAISAGKVSMVTDHIETFTETGIRLRSGQELEADIIVTATGLALKLMGGMGLLVDGQPVELPRTLVYKGMMCRDVPNLAFAIGYTNASWTLKVDLTSEYVCRLLNYMDAHGYRQCAPRSQDSAMGEEPIINFTSGYIQRAIDMLPKQGSKAPWKLYQNYVLDLLTLRYGRVNDGTMEFG
jgi:cation diffusion facilitator CzcD-associated flavoprotein CzcO